MKFVFSTLVFSFIAGAAGGQASAQSSMPMAAMAFQSGQGQEAVTEGEVRQVDLAAQKLTLKHGDIKNLGMPGMTMVFKVTDPTLLSRVKEGDKVHFTADRIDGALTVTSIEPTAQ